MADVEAARVDVQTIMAHEAMIVELERQLAAAKLEFEAMFERYVKVGVQEGVHRVKRSPAAQDTPPGYYVG